MKHVKLYEEFMNMQLTKESEVARYNRHINAILYGKGESEMSLEDAIEKEKRQNDKSRFETLFPTRALREIENTENHKDLSNSAKKVLDRLKKKYSIKE